MLLVDHRPPEEKRKAEYRPQKRNDRYELDQYVAPAANRAKTS
jgi:hypothetical protein